MKVLGAVGIGAEKEGSVGLTSNSSEAGVCSL